MGNWSLRSTVTPSSFPTPPGSSSKGLEKETLACQDTSHPGWTAQDGVHPKEGSQEKSTLPPQRKPREIPVIPVMGYNQVKMSRTRRKGQPQRGYPASASWEGFCQHPGHTVGRRRCPHGHGEFGKRPGPTGVASTLPRQEGEGRMGKVMGLAEVHISEGELHEGERPCAPIPCRAQCEWKAPKHLLRIELKYIVFIKAPGIQ